MLLTVPEDDGIRLEDDDDSRETTLRKLHARDEFYRRRARGVSPLVGSVGVSIGEKAWERGKLDKEEARILDLLARGPSREFPNPERVGCPDSEVLRGIALRELRLPEVHQWLDHLGSCSPCYQEFTELRKQAARSSKR